MEASAPVVVKVGGSLFDLPNLGAHLKRWLDRLGSPVLIVPGGGRAVDAVRDLDRTHKLGEETCHWLALEAMSQSALFLSKLLDNAPVIKKAPGQQTDKPNGRLAILDAHLFAREDEGLPGCLPHCWDVTSDSIAARAAAVFGASSLVLLKSAAIPNDASLAQAQQMGIVDPYFRKALIPAINLQLLNFGQWAHENPAL
ncbi:MAG: uridylate kinase [Gemmataceae bacterium]